MWSSDDPKVDVVVGGEVPPVVQTAAVDADCGRMGEVTLLPSVARAVLTVPLQREYDLVDVVRLAVHSSVLDQLVL